MRQLIRNTALLLALVTIPGALLTGQTAPLSQAEKSVRVQMRNVLYHFNESIAVHIVRSDGELIVQKGSVPIFDDKQSFNIAIDTAQVRITTYAMQHVLNDYVFSAKDAALKKIVVEVDSSRLKVKGALHSKGDVAFELVATLSATPEGMVRLHAEKIKAAHLPIKGLMDLLGLEVADLINTKQVSGVRAERNDLLLDPQTLLPPPHIQGRVTEVRLSGGQIVQTFGRLAEAERSSANGNYMAYRGNVLRFGKLTMQDTDLVLMDMDPADPFDFYLDHYKEQLVAGYTKTTPAFGLRVYMRDFDKLHEKQRIASSRQVNTPSKR